MDTTQNLGLKSIRFAVLETLGWSGALKTNEEWLNWAKNEELDLTVFSQEIAPILDFLPISQRKKTSFISSATLYIGYNLLRKYPDIPIVFASRHGEIKINLNLLESIYQDEALSPMQFSRSVHNSGVGLVSIAAKNTSNYTAISGGEESFISGLLESVSLLDSKVEKVLYIYGEEILPERYRSFIDEPQLAYCFGVVLEKQKLETRNGVINNYTIDFSSQGTSQKNYLEVFKFIKGILKNEPNIPLSRFSLVKSV